MNNEDKVKYIELKLKEIKESVEEKDKEIERLQKARENEIIYNKYLQSELAKANNIINELEKYFEQEGFWHSLDKIRELKGREILDKENK